MAAVSAHFNGRNSRFPYNAVNVFFSEAGMPSGHKGDQKSLSFYNDEPVVMLNKKHYFVYSILLATITGIPTLPVSKTEETVSPRESGDAVR